MMIREKLVPHVLSCQNHRPIEWVPPAQDFPIPYLIYRTRLLCEHRTRTSPVWWLSLGGYDQTLPMTRTAQGEHLIILMKHLRTR